MSRRSYVAMSDSELFDIIENRNLDGMLAAHDLKRRCHMRSDRGESMLAAFRKRFGHDLDALRWECVS